MQNIANLKDVKGRPWMDFTSLNKLMTCPRQYWLSAIQKINTVGVKPALINGTAYHECKAAYLKSRLKGADHELAKLVGMEVLVPIMEQITEPDPARNLTNAQITMDNYFDYYQDEVYEPIEGCVEVHFAIDMVDFLYVGNIDAIKNWPGFGLLVEETKSTSIIGTRWELRGKPNLQIDGYFAAAYIITGQLPYAAQLDVIPVHKDPLLKKNFPFRILTIRNEKDVDAWAHNVRHWWHTKMEYEAKGFFPQNTERCVPLVGFGCEYTTLCEMYPNPHDLDSLELPGHYEISEWAPYEELKQIENEAQ